MNGHSVTESPARPSRKRGAGGRAPREAGARGRGVKLPISAGQTSRAPKGDPEERRPDKPRSDKYDRILQAAIEVFAANGYFNSRVADIAKRAGIADGTVYLYFRNKEQILMAAIDFAFETFMEAARKEIAEIAEPRARLHRLAYLHLHSLGSNRGLAMVFQTELRQSAKFLGEFSHKHLISYFDLVRSIVQDGQDRGQFRGDVSGKIVANCFFGALDAMVTSWLLSERPYELSGAATPVVALLLNGLEIS